MNLKEIHTFVICAYGNSSYLEECMLSLVNQHNQSSIILYTSTPSLQIEELCKKYNIAYYHGSGGSIGKDWNNALSCVKTRYATIAHQDDYYEPQYSELIIKKFQSNPDALIAYSDYFEEKNGKKIERTLNLKIKRLMLRTINLFPKSKLWRTRVLAFGNAICCPSVSYDLSVLNGFKFDEKLKGNLDWIAWYQIGKMKGSFVYVDKPLMCHRIHEESETSKTISNNTRSQEDLETLEIFWPKWFAKILMKQYVKSQKTNG